MADYKKSPNAPTKTSILKKAIPKPKGNPAVPKGRTYLFELPHPISNWEAFGGIPQLQNAGIWDQIPADLREKLEAISKEWSGSVMVTKQDLDRIPTPAWTQIAQMLGVEWK